MNMYPHRPGRTRSQRKIRERKPGPANFQNGDKFSFTDRFLQPQFGTRQVAHGWGYLTTSTMKSHSQLLRILNAQIVVRVVIPVLAKAAEIGLNALDGDTERVDLRKS